MSKSRGMSHNPAHLPCKWRNADINEVQSWASHGVGLTSSKPSSPTKRLGSRILRGYCGAGEFVVPAHFTLGPKAQAEETHCRRRIMKAQKGPRMWPRMISCSASHRTPKEKGQAQCRSRSREKAANTAIKNTAFDRSRPSTMLFSFYNYSQPLQAWADKTSLNPRKWSLHVGTRRGVNASIKGKENQWKGGSGARKSWERRIITSSSSDKV